jgi:hypothetical protein
MDTPTDEYSTLLFGLGVLHLRIQTEVKGM